MLDEMERLKESDGLQELLGHYTALGKVNREIWQDRLHELGECRGRDLIRLYGELLAHGWLEQNTGITPVLEKGRFAACYRVTSTGQCAYRQARKELAESC